MFRSCTRYIFLPALLFFTGTTVPAQPSATQVKNDFLKNGVTDVEGIVINKEWYKDHYLWKASFRTILPVKPEEVEGLKGVTMVRHVVAHYECSGSSCSKNWSGLAYSEYKGIDLPLPSAGELNDMLKKEAAARPELFFRSMSGKLDITEIGIHATEPKYEWVNPKKLTFNAYKKNREEANYTEIALVETPLGVTLLRDGMKSPWRISSAVEMREKLVQISRSNKNDAANAGIQAAQFSSDEAKNKAEMERLKTPVPPKFVTMEAAANDAYLMLFNLTREQYYYYIGMMLSPEFRCSGCMYTLNENGKRRVNEIISAAYDGNGNFRDQFCMTPSFSIEGSAAYFKNRKNDMSAGSFFMIDKVGEYYYINSATLRVSKDATANAALKALNCGANDGLTGPANEPVPAAGSWKTGDKVMVKDAGKWYPATVLQVQGGKWFVHYDGWDAKYDAWVGPNRIKSN